MPGGSPALERVRARSGQIRGQFRGEPSPCALASRWMLNWRAMGWRALRGRTAGPGGELTLARGTFRFEEALGQQAGRDEATGGRVDWAAGRVHDGERPQRRLRRAPNAWRTKATAQRQTDEPPGLSARARAALGDPTRRRGARCTGVEACVGPRVEAPAAAEVEDRRRGKDRHDLAAHRSDTPATTELTEVCHDATDGREPVAAPAREERHLGCARQGSRLAAGRSRGSRAPRPGPLHPRPHLPVRARRSSPSATADSAARRDRPRCPRRR